MRRSVCRPPGMARRRGWAREQGSLTASRTARSRGPPGIGEYPRFSSLRGCAGRCRRQLEIRGCRVAAEQALDRSEGSPSCGPSDRQSRYGPLSVTVTNRPLRQLIAGGGECLRLCPLRSPTHRCPASGAPSTETVAWRRIAERGGKLDGDAGCARYDAVRSGTAALSGAVERRHEVADLPEIVVRRRSGMDAAKPPASMMMVRHGRRPAGKGFDLHSRRRRRAHRRGSGGTTSGVRGASCVERRACRHALGGHIGALMRQIQHVAAAETPDGPREKSVGR